LSVARLEDVEPDSKSTSRSAPSLGNSFGEGRGVALARYLGSPTKSIKLFDSVQIRPQHHGLVVQELLLLKGRIASLKKHCNTTRIRSNSNHFHLSTGNPEYLDQHCSTYSRTRSYQMPVTNSFLPLRQQELNQKIRANEPDQMAQLLKDVKDHVSDKPSTVVFLLTSRRSRGVLPFTNKVHMAQEM